MKLLVSIEETSSRLSLPYQTIERSLRILQSFDPAGVGAKELIELLLLQIRRNSDSPLFSEEIIMGYFTDLAQGKLDKIIRKLGITKYEASTAIAYIQTLSPRPFASIGSLSTIPVVADAQIVILSNSKYEKQIKIQYGYSPKISFDVTYIKLASEATDDARAYFEEKTKLGHLLIKNMKYRNLTIKKVIEVIVKEQFDFFFNGHSGLKPLTLKILSEKSGLHESTISRAIRIKYMDTPRGIIELKYFLSNSISTSDGGVSSKFVKH